MVQLVEDRDLCDLGAADLGRLIATGRVSAVDVLAAQLDRIDRNGALGAVVSLDTDGARLRAQAADDALAAGRPIGPLDGVPITLKDGNDVAGLRTTIGTTSWTMSPAADGTVAARLRAAGANIIGHSNVAAWLADHQSANPVFGRTSNPWDLEPDVRRFQRGRRRGGGQRHDAARRRLGPGRFAAPAGQFLRRYALKTTEHRVPLTGFFRTPDGAPRPLRIMLSLGPLARDLDDLELALSVIAGPDGFDGDVPPVPLARRDARGPGDLRVAVAPAIPGAPVAKVLRDRVTRWQVPSPMPAGRCGRHSRRSPGRSRASCSASSSSCSPRSSRPDGADLRLARYLELLSRRDELIGCWERFFEQYDALLMPPAATVAYPHCPPGEPLSLDDGQIAYY